MSRCVDAEAFEVNKDDLSNGIFINFLKQRVMEDEKVTVMLDRVAEGMTNEVLKKNENIFWSIVTLDIVNINLYKWLLM